CGTTSDSDVLRLAKASNSAHVSPADRQSYEPLLKACQRPVSNPLRQRESPPQIPKIVGDHTQPPAHLVGSETDDSAPRHLHRLLTFFDPLLGRASLIVEPHHVAAVCLQVGCDASDPQEQLPA